MTWHTFFSLKFIILAVYVASVTYTQLRGKVRHKFFRQLLDHSTFMSPINAVMYLFSAIPNQPFFDKKDFPELKVLRDNWQILRDEAAMLFQQGHIKASAKLDDVGFNSFFKTGWKRFYLKWYENYLPSAQQLCPKTVALLQSVPTINSAMFALLPKDGKLCKHRDPYAGSIRYHLGLITPNSDKCCIYVDGIPYAWKDGEDVLFDETYIHYAHNQTDQDRIILFCDIERPLTNKIAITINRYFKKYVLAESAAQNLETDKIGFVNKIFKYIYAVRLLAKRFKKFNRKLYYFSKYTAFFLLLYLIFS